MESTAATPVERKITATTIAGAFRATVAAQPDEVAVRTTDDAISWTWQQLSDRVDTLAAGLHGLGLRRGDCIALMLSNRPEFHLCDLAAIVSGATPFSIYQTYAPNQIQYVVEDSAARILVTEPQYLDNVLTARADLPNLEHVIVVDGDVPADCISLADVEAAGVDNADFDVEASIAAIDPETVLTLIYTSGTTGPPKGVELVHRNLIAATLAVEQLIRFPPRAKVISWLPAAHIAERVAHHYLPIVFGLSVTTCPDPRKIAEVLPAVQPTWFFAVPRIWEKLKAGLETMVAGLEGEAAEKVHAAMDAALAKVRLEQAEEEVPAELAAAVAKADEELFSNLRRSLGFGEFAAVNVGAAPTPPEVLEFFHAIGIPVAELWGMSETCGAGCCNPPDRVKIGTVGPPAPGIEVKLGSDGELLMRSDVVMAGYRNMPDETAETVVDGWLHTGDIATIDDDGYVTIVDRKKEIIINAAGKNMSPAMIESTVKASSALIGQACCIGDARRYNTALIVLDADFAPAWAAKHGIEDTSLAALADDETVRAEVQSGIDAANAKLARVEQIKTFTIVGGDWLPGGDELTPTMKLKRKPIAEKYAGDIEAMYA